MDKLRVIIALSLAKKTVALSGVSYRKKPPKTARFRARKYPYEDITIKEYRFPKYCKNVTVLLSFLGKDTQREPGNDTHGFNPHA